MKYGRFDDQNLEYVIDRPDTPLPWINYLGNQSYFRVISNTAGGYSFYKDARLRRLTRYRYNNAPLDSGGHYVYLRDDRATEPFFWSPTWQPTRKTLDAYECRHGLGYTTITSRLNGIESSSRYFIPLGEDLEIWEFTLTNLRHETAELSVFSAVEFCLWDAVDDATNFQRNYSIGEVEVVDGVIYHKSEYRERRNHFAYFACSEPLQGFDTQRDDFLGPYRGWDSPAVVEKGETHRSIAMGWQPVGVHHVKVVLPPGTSKKIIFLLGYQQNDPAKKFDPPSSQVINKENVKPVITRYLDPQTVEDAFLALKDYWRGLLGKLQVVTPDLHTNRMVNIWNVYQVMTTFNFSRSASYFESGIGRGIGFRDSNQDLLGFMHLLPERAKGRILDLAATQLPTGGAYHQYQPLTKLGNNEIGSHFNDDPLWLVLSVSAYIKETGDWTILNETVRFDNLPGSEQTLYVHLQRSVQYTLDRLGPHGLPLIGRADWNDCLNLNCYSDQPGQSFQTTTNKDGKVAESVFIAGLFVLACKEMEEIAQRTGNGDEASRIRESRLEMERITDQAGWDGDWFRRAYDNSSEPVGSATCQEGKIFIEPQGICVMAGIGIENSKALKALESVQQHLLGKRGIALLDPPFSHYHPELGEISSYPPGYKENGSVFCHTNPWIMIAETRLGRGDIAHDYYLRINPSVLEDESEIHRTEPYVYAQMISGPRAVKQGEAKNSWLTGSASWNYVAICQYILGIRPAFDGLQIEPVFPSSWKGFDVIRSFRGVDYHITVERVGAGNQVEIAVDGQPIKGNVIPQPSEDKSSVNVLVKVS